jgi:pimeloyl-ACP methyl ester carboxylesterase
MTQPPARGWSDPTCPPSGLATIRIGQGPIRFVFCHGLFGQGRNWTTIARRLEPAASLLVDLPDHGRSPRTDRFSYDTLAESVAGLLRAVRAEEGAYDLTLVGHSMGGRAVMLTALRYPQLVPRLVVVDVGPAPTPTSDFERYADALQRLDLDRLASRRDADHALALDIPDPTVRGFLLAGLQPTATGGWQWLFHLDLLQRDLGAVVNWEPPSPVEPYPGPVEWLLGERSDHVPAASHARMRELFPRLRTVIVKGAGHWVQADAPGVVTEAIRRFATSM